MMKAYFLFLTTLLLLGCSSIAKNDDENLYMQELWFNEKLWLSQHQSEERQRNDYMSCMISANRFEENRAKAIGKYDASQTDNLKANVEICMVNKGYTPKSGTKALICDQFNFTQLPVCVAVKQMTAQRD